MYWQGKVSLCEVRVVLLVQSYVKSLILKRKVENIMVGSRENNYRGVLVRFINDIIANDIYGVRTGFQRVKSTVSKQEMQYGMMKNQSV